MSDEEKSAKLNYEAQFCYCGKRAHFGLPNGGWVCRDHWKGAGTTPVPVAESNTQSPAKFAGD
jgi:hypothetical protein